MISLDFNNLDEQDCEYAKIALSSGQISTAGKYVIEFEQAMAEVLDTNHIFATNSCSAALHLSLLSAGIQRGDEVLVPAMSFIGSANVVQYVNAKPVFVDIDLDTWCIDIRKAEKKINRKTQAIIPVHLYGNPCDMQSIWNMATVNSLTIIADGAESLGAFYKDKQIEKWGHYSCVSFNGNKVITTSGGGLVICLNNRIRQYVNKLGRQGLDDSVISYNYRMTSLAAALGLSQIKKLDHFVNKKRRFNYIYRNELDKLIKFQQPTRYSNPSWWYTAGIFDTFTGIAPVMEKLKEKGVPTRRVFFPLPFTKAHYDDGYYPNAQYIFRHGICLPTSTKMEENDVMEVCRIVKEVL